MDDEPATFEAVISLEPTSSGGLSAPMPSGTRSLLLVVASGLGSEQTMLGAVIDALDRDALTPSDSHIPVRLRPWADEAGKLLTPGSGFDLRYAGRIVGRGVVSES